MFIIRLINHFVPQEVAIRNKRLSAVTLLFFDNNNIGDEGMDLLKHLEVGLCRWRYYKRGEASGDGEGGGVVGRVVVD